MDWANIINAIGVIVVAYFTYNQYTKNKVTDYKLEKWKAEDKVQNKKRIDNGMIVYIAQINRFILVEMSKVRDRCEQLSTFCGFKNGGKMELFTKLSTLSTFFTCFLHKNKLVNKKICFVKKDKNAKCEKKILTGKLCDN